MAAALKSRGAGSGGTPGTWSSRGGSERLGLVFEADRDAVVANEHCEAVEAQRVRVHLGVGGQPGVRRPARPPAAQAAGRALLVAEPLRSQLAEGELARIARARDQQAGAGAPVDVFLEQPVAEPLEVLARVLERAVGWVRARGRGQGVSCHFVAPSARSSGYAALRPCSSPVGA